MAGDLGGGAFLSLLFNPGDRFLTLGGIVEPEGVEISKARSGGKRAYRGRWRQQKKDRTTRVVQWQYPNLDKTTMVNCNATRRKSRPQVATGRLIAGDESKKGSRRSLKMTRQGGEFGWSVHGVRLAVAVLVQLMVMLWGASHCILLGSPRAWIPMKKAPVSSKLPA